MDFFTPIVDNPFDFGRIAAANSLSDVYAMGGTPKTALNIVAYPIHLGQEILREILAGGAAVLKEANTVLLGGHSVEDDELKYGLSVTGFIDPARIFANQGLKEGDQLILTKPLGTGIVNTAIKAGLASEQTITQVTGIMATLNRAAAEVMADFRISACTDITGFGLLGHLAEMIVGTATRVVIDTAKVPILPEAQEFGSMGFVPEGAHRNRMFRQNMVTADDDFNPVLRDILFDPQTSGGLLIGCDEKDAVRLLERLRDSGIESSAIIGEVHKNPNHEILLR